MKQKLGLACTLVRSPQLLLLDEPTVGVDPLSRSELWDIIGQLVHDQGLTVLMSTSYLDEAEKCAHVLVMHEGKILTQGDPGEIARQAEQRVFVAGAGAGRRHGARHASASYSDDDNIIDAVPEAGRVRFVVKQADTVVAAVITRRNARVRAGSFRRWLHDLAQTGQALSMPAVSSSPNTWIAPITRSWWTCTIWYAASARLPRWTTSASKCGAVKSTVCSARTAAGKTTTFRMLCGPAQGQRRLAGGGRQRLASCPSAGATEPWLCRAEILVIPNAVAARRTWNSLASAYNLRGAKRIERIRWALEQFELEQVADTLSSQLPGGYKQRLAMGAGAGCTNPTCCFWTNPPAARIRWRAAPSGGRITALADQGVTVIVTTHIMQEAEYCDRIAILDSGKNSGARYARRDSSRSGHA